MSSKAPDINDLPAALRDRIIRKDGHWLWTGKTANGTQTVYLSSEGKQVNVRRYAREALGRPVSDGLGCYRTCDEPKCVHPDHTEDRVLGSRAAPAETPLPPGSRRCSDCPAIIRDVPSTIPASARMRCLACREAGVGRNEAHEAVALEAATNPSGIGKNGPLSAAAQKAKKAKGKAEPAAPEEMAGPAAVEASVEPGPARESFQPGERPAVNIPDKPITCPECGKSDTEVLDPAPPSIWECNTCANVWQPDVSDKPLEKAVISAADEAAVSEILADAGLEMPAQEPPGPAERAEAAQADESVSVAEAASEVERDLHQAEEAPAPVEQAAQTAPAYTLVEAVESLFPRRLASGPADDFAVAWLRMAAHINLPDEGALAIALDFADVLHTGLRMAGKDLVIS